jgi:hypothetical protein
MRRFVREHQSSLFLDFILQITIALRFTLHYVKLLHISKHDGRVDLKWATWEVDILMWLMTCIA